MLFEVVSGQILLSKRREFFSLHDESLLPMMKAVGIVPCLLLFTEVGRYGRFLDIYRYDDFTDYQSKTDALLTQSGIEDYYAKVGQCIDGSITVELMRELPYAHRWLGSE